MLYMHYKKYYTNMHCIVMHDMQYIYEKEDLADEPTNPDFVEDPNDDKVNQYKLTLIFIKLDQLLKNSLILG